MEYFTISQLAQFSGIKPHTIRMWEQRYGALQPERSGGNTRSYDNNQLRRLLNIVSLSEDKYKISELCSMPDAVLFNLVKAKKIQESPVDSKEYFISQMMSAAMAFDEIHFEQIFSNSLLQFGLKGTYTEIFCPLLIRMGLMWSTDTLPPAHEHFLSNFIRQKLYSAINFLPSPNNNKYEWLLFLPENDFHEIGLLFSHYLIRLAGRGSLYLGSNVPMNSLAAAAKIVKPPKILVYLVQPNSPENLNKYLFDLVGLFKNKELYVAGNQRILNNISINKKITKVDSVKILEQILFPPV